MVLLKENSRLYNLIITKDLEDQIRHLCNKINNIEWSGILFYETKGNIENDDLEIIAKDLFLMDIGNSSMTEFTESPEIANYIAMNNLFECEMGLIHSHHTMSAFFSSTDENTLLSEGKLMNHFLSLIVNNEGFYKARITCKKEVKQEIKETIEYKTFNNEKCSKVDRYSINKTIVEYFNLNINYPVMNIEEIDKRIENLNNKKHEDEIPNLFDDYKLDETINALLLNIITLTPFDFDVNIDKWVSHMNFLFDKRFYNVDNFENFFLYYVDGVLVEFFSSNSDMPYDETVTILIEKLNKLNKNKYIDCIIKVLSNDKRI